MRDIQLQLPERHSRTTLFEIEVPIYPYKIRKGENRISLTPRENPTKPYINPLIVAMECREALDSGKYRNQTELARSLKVTRSRVNQYLRLLKLPDEVKEEVLSGRVKATERGLRMMLPNK